jgi:hypothetical protein
MAQATVTEESVIEILEPLYGSWGFAKTNLPAKFAALLNDAEKSSVEDEGDASEAASEIRSDLWNYYTGGGASASATCQLFYTLGRQNELGWVEGEAPGFRFND